MIVVLNVIYPENYNIFEVFHNFLESRMTVIS